MKCARALVDCARALVNCARAPVGLGSTSDVRVTLGVPPKFLGWLRAAPGQPYLANVAQGLGHAHNGPESPEPLRAPGEGHPASAIRGSLLRKCLWRMLLIWLLGSPGSI